MNEFKLPDVGEGLTEADIVEWRVQVGDEIKINDVVVEIETAKSLVELPSPYAGTVQALLVPEGETVAVGTPIIRIGQGAPVPAPDAQSAPPAAAPVEDEKHLTLVGYGPRAQPSRRRKGGGHATAGAGATFADRPPTVPQAAVTTVRQPAVTAVPQPPEQPAGTPEAAGAAAPSSSSYRPLAKPPVRKLARDLRVDLATVVPSGPNGTILRHDVELAAAGAAGVGSSAGSTAADGRSCDAPVVASTVDGETRERRVPIRGVRKSIAQAMVDSAFTAPHVTGWVTVDVTRTVKYLDRLKTSRAFEGVRISPLLAVAKAAIIALRHTPELNATWDDANQEIVYKNYVNLGIAAATPRGLIVPNIRDAHLLGLVDLARALAALTQTAREGKTQPTDVSGGSFTITSVGNFGLDAGTPIINPGESGILCFGAIRRQPWVVTRKGKEVLEPRHVTTLALSSDHRIVDGEPASRFLRDVAAILQDPRDAMLY
ncbi:dihydrolipoamide acetyltransferase family protein [Georgenia yuyongxinii]|uniref:dihydrolipoamide acetyltransferase family protein n=1 Tax=Georgenia yuyongxinii TaxID=2589797 RepID=UPI001E4CD9B6|nr:dihydrolipoamide acetyltransferase family protein [Georgenia yuyongxinii]